MDALNPQEVFFSKHKNDVYAGLCVYIIFHFLVLFGSSNFASQSKDRENPFGRENA